MNISNKRKRASKLKEKKTNWVFYNKAELEFFRKWKEDFELALMYGNKKTEA